MKVNKKTYDLTVNITTQYMATYEEESESDAKYRFYRNLKKKNPDFPFFMHELDIKCQEI